MNRSYIIITDNDLTDWHRSLWLEVPSRIGIPVQLEKNQRKKERKYSVRPTELEQRTSPVINKGSSFFLSTWYTILPSLWPGHATQL